LCDVPLEGGSGKAPAGVKTVIADFRDATSFVERFAGMERVVFGVFAGARAGGAGREGD